LHVNGKWEFVNLQKAVAAKEIANKLGPEANFAPGNHGNFFSYGYSRIFPVDKDYQTCSRSGKGFFVYY